MKTTLSKFILLLLVVSGVSMSSALAQERVIKGTIRYEEDGKELVLPGASIVIEGTQSGTTSNIEGEYSLSASAGDVLIVSFIGYKTKKVTVGNQDVINIMMESDIEALSEVIVVGYGAVRKSDLTGSVASVDQESITAFPALSAIQTLQGRATGLQIQSNNGGEPGANFNVKIRGGTSLNASSNPIRVVDGFVGAEMPPPEDIASIEILKDASATAIYGSRGANGVIMVTTKKGSSGEVKIDINSSYSVQEVLNNLDLLNADEFGNYIREINPGYTNFGGNTNWQDQIYRSGYISNNQLSISGGSANVRYYISGTAFSQEGVILNSDYERYTLNSNLSIQAKEYLNIGLNLYARRSFGSGIRTQETTGGSGSAGAVSSAFRFNPDLGIYDADGDFTISEVGDDIDNPYALTSEYVREDLNDRFQINTFAEIDLLDWLKFKTTLGATVSNQREGEYFPTTLLRGAGDGGRAILETQKSSSLLNENYFTAAKDFGTGNLNVVLGYSYQANSREDLSARGSNYLTDAGTFWALQNGSTLDFPESGITESFIKSYYTRANYSILDKYIFTFTARYDGASNFAANNKWAFFPSGAIGWDMMAEPFLQNQRIFNQWKWRVSYGLVGNQAIGPYQSLSKLESIYGTSGGNLVNAVKGGDLENPNLTWETTSQLDIGADIGILNGRINISSDYYIKTTSDLLFARPLAPITGRSFQLQNIGKVENKGVEFALNSRNFVNDFQWTTDFNVSFNRSKILELPDDNTDIFYGSAPGHFLLADDTQILRAGQPVGVFYGFIYEGVYQNGDEFLDGSGFEKVAGGEKFRDLNPDGVLSNQDRTVIGDPNPDFIWALNNTFSYKNFDLNIFIQGSQGGDMLSYTLMELDILSGANNATKTALDRWTPTSPNTDVPKASGGRSKRVSSRWVYDASYARLKNIILGYTLPKATVERLKLRSLRIFVSAQNLLTITSFPGLDPEVGYRNSSNNANSNLMRGLDYGSYPNVKNYTVGIKIGL